MVLLFAFRSDSKLSAPQNAAACPSFVRVAKTVTLIGRFKSRAQRRHISFGQCYVEPVRRQSAHGVIYWSVLEEENSQHLDQFGFYCRGVPGSAPRAESRTTQAAKKRVGWAAAKAAVTKSASPVADVPDAGSKKSPTLVISGAAGSAGSKSPTSPSRTGARKPSDVPIEAADEEEMGLIVPARFRSRRSSLLFPLPQQPVPGPDADLRPRLPGRIPTIEINNNETAGDPLRSRHSARSGFDWYRSFSYNWSSVSSSSTTDDVPSPSSTDSYTRRLEKIRADRRASVPWVPVETDGTGDRLLLRVSSDAASTVSSQTLVDGGSGSSFDATGPETTGGDQSMVADSHAERIRQRRLDEGRQELEPDSFDIEEVSELRVECCTVYLHCFPLVLVFCLNRLFFLR